MREALDHPGAESASPDPEARLQLAGHCFVLGRYDESRAQLELAVGEFTERGAQARAAWAAACLGRILLDGLGNRLAAKAWFARAERLLAGVGHCVEEGWVAVARTGCCLPDPADLLARAELALERAQEFRDADLEAKGRADGGLALVLLGRVEEGMAWLDEAMALVTGNLVSDLSAAGSICCNLFSACQETREIGRVHEWGDILRAQGFLGDKGGPGILGAHCATVYGSLLCECGRWAEADAVLEHGLELTGSGSHYSRGAAVAALADLRVRQGRLDEAERLLVGFEDLVEATVPLARLHHTRGEHDLAAAVARRGVRTLGDDRMRSPALLGILVDAELARGDIGAAREACQELERRAGTAAPAEVALAVARVAAGAGDAPAAVGTLEQALAGMDEWAAPLLAVTMHRELAHLHPDPAAARAEEQAAAAIEARLDLHGRWLPGPSLAPGPPAMLRRAGDDWVLTVGGSTLYLRATKGLSYLGVLLGAPAVEHHVLDLVEAVEGAPEEPGIRRRDLGDAGEMLDGAAKAAYRRRLEALRADLDEADAREDDDAMVAIQGEIDALVAELSRAVGLGGRDRRAASVVEKARLNVTRALRAAIARIEESFPDAGRDLGAGVRTGIYCSYQAPPGGTPWAAS
ncbi:MAG TPA: hypothetical protein VFW71_04515 [Actinomycetota bacterium]|nr:hypothetical protein [Actinomycetota bacterium]